MNVTSYDFEIDPECVSSYIGMGILIITTVVSEVLALSGCKVNGLAHAVVVVARKVQQVPKV